MLNWNYGTPAPGATILNQMFEFIFPGSREKSFVFFFSSFFPIVFVFSIGSKLKNSRRHVKSGGGGAGGLRFPPKFPDSLKMAIRVYLPFRDFSFNKFFLAFSHELANYECTIPLSLPFYPVGGCVYSRRRAKVISNGWETMERDSCSILRPFLMLSRQPDEYNNSPDKRELIEHPSGDNPSSLHGAHNFLLLRRLHLFARSMKLSSNTTK